MLCVPMFHLAHSNPECWAFPHQLEQRSLFPRTRPCVAEARLGLAHTPAPSLSTFISAAVTAWGFLVSPEGSLAGRGHRPRASCDPFPDPVERGLRLGHLPVGSSRRLGGRGFVKHVGTILQQRKVNGSESQKLLEQFVSRFRFLKVDSDVLMARREAGLPLHLTQRLGGLNLSQSARVGCHADPGAARPLGRLMLLFPALVHTLLPPGMEVPR